MKLTEYVSPIDRYRELMRASSAIAAVLIMTPHEPKPIAYAVTLATELEAEVASALGMENE